MKNYNNIEEINTDYQELMKKHFKIANDYVMGIVTKNDVDDFGKFLSEMRHAIELIEMTEENMFFIAEIKSKLQHYYTEIMEDEELLSIAYGNDI